MSIQIAALHVSWTQKPLLLVHDKFITSGQPDIWDNTNPLSVTD